MLLEKLSAVFNVERWRAMLSLAFSTPLVIVLLCRLRQASLGLSSRDKEWCVVRCAAKDKQTRETQGGSRSAQRKLDCESIYIGKDGVIGVTRRLLGKREICDYNNYRAQGHQGRFSANTPDRAVSLITVSAYEDLRRKLPSARIALGDLGENLLVDGPSHVASDLLVGTKLRIGSEAVIEITQVNNPCYRFAHLPWAHEGKRLFGEKWWLHPDLALKDTGGRGWLAKVLVEGAAERGANMEILR